MLPKTSHNVSLLLLMLDLEAAYLYKVEVMCD